MAPGGTEPATAFTTFQAATPMCLAKPLDASDFASILTPQPPRVTSPLFDHLAERSSGGGGGGGGGGSGGAKEARARRRRAVEKSAQRRHRHRAKNTPPPGFTGPPSRLARLALGAISAASPPPRYTRTAYGPTDALNFLSFELDLDLDRSVAKTESIR